MRSFARAGYPLPASYPASCFLLLTSSRNQREAFAKQLNRPHSARKPRLQLIVRSEPSGGLDGCCVLLSALAHS